MKAYSLGKGLRIAAAGTGESLPVSRRPESRVFNGTVIASGYLVVRADRKWNSPDQG